MLKRLAAALGLLAVTVASFAAVWFLLDEPERNGGGAASPTSSRREMGAEVYEADCSRCHGVGGTGGTGGLGPALIDVAERFPNVDDEIAVVTNGRGTMPGLGGQLDAEQIRAVVKYTRDLR